MAGFRLNLELADGFAAVPEILNRTRRQLDLAAARALRKTGQWLRTHSTREIAKELGIVQSPIRHRYSIYSQATANQVKVWVGLQPISVHYLGDPKQTATGVKVGHRIYDDAFIGQMKNGPEMVFRRKGRERLPLERVTEDWEGPAMTVLERWEQRAQRRFVELFEQEARYVLEGTR
ncbi:phage tail protein [Pseudomonas luteola]|uniref:phage tail protein n=1 Tax=Pseudomonas luteola TaxID=47886 RepID=UPI001C613067|nr:phage tail protein [Pseudomonas zeshuii]